MHMPNFAYVRPKTLQEAIKHLLIPGSMQAAQTSSVAFGTRSLGPKRSLVSAISKTFKGYG